MNKHMRAFVIWFLQILIALLVALLCLALWLFVRDGWPLLFAICEGLAALLVIRFCLGNEAARASTQ